MKPIPDEVFDVDPVEFDMSEMDKRKLLRPLLQALRSGRIPAWGNMILEGANDFLDPDWDKYSSAYNARLPDACWVWHFVLWSFSGILYLKPKDLVDDYAARNEPVPDDLTALFSLSEKLRVKYMEPRLTVDSVKVDVQSLLHTFPETPAPDESASEIYKSPYLRFMEHASRELGMTPDRRVPKQHIEEWLDRNWWPSLGNLSQSKREYMATFIRDPEDGKGGHFRPDRKRKGRT